MDASHGGRKASYRAYSAFPPTQRGAAADVAKVLKPGGVFVYTVRHTGDAHHGTGVSHGDGI